MADSPKPKTTKAAPESRDPKPDDVITVTLPSGTRVTGPARLVNKRTK